MSVEQFVAQLRATKNPHFCGLYGFFDGRGSGIRTRDLLLPKQEGVPWLLSDVAALQIDAKSLARSLPQTSRAGGV